MDKKETTIEDLAVMVQNGFTEIHEKMDKRFDHVEKELSHMNAQLSTIESDVADIKRDMVHRNEFEDLMGRVKYLELKLGIQSGK